MYGSVTEFGHSILKRETDMSQQPIPLETLTTRLKSPVLDNQNSINARLSVCQWQASLGRRTMHVEERFKEMIKRFSKLTTPVNPFLLRILRTCEARTMLLGIVTFATLLCSSCANGGGGVRASFISASDRQQDSFGMGAAAQNSAIVDWSKPAREQPGIMAPEFGGRGEP
jgi:hypothetical protein